ELVDRVVGDDGGQPSPEAWDAGGPLNRPEERQVEADEHRQSEPVHRDMVFLLSFLPFVGTRFVFVALMVNQGVRAKRTLDVLGGVKEVLMERPLEEACIEEIEDEREQLTF